MSYAAFVLASISFIISLGALIALIDIKRGLRRTSSFAPSFDEQLTKDAWLEEIEARGEAVLTRILEAEKRLGPSEGTSVVHPATQPMAPAPVSSTSMSASRSTALPPTAPTPPSATVPDEPDSSRTAGVSDVDERNGETTDPGAIKDEVLRLADEGLDVTAIARKLALGRGEVELFLGLARRPNDG